MDDAPIIGPEFFDVRYAAGKMPWDFGGVPKSLKVFLDTHHKSGRVLIPGSGSGYEIEAFSSSGWDVIGIDARLHFMPVIHYARGMMLLLQVGPNPSSWSRYSRAMRGSAHASASKN